MLPHQARIRVQSYDRTMDAHQNRFKAIAELVGDVMAETLWPTRCAVCDMPGQLLCEACARRLTAIDACLACPTCGAPFGRIQCTECNETMLAAIGLARFPLDGMASMFVANESEQRIVKAYKDQGERRLSAFIAQSTARCIPPAWTDKPSALTFIPDTAASLRRRGFDHACELACLVANQLGCDCLGLLERPRSTDQRTLTRKERFANMSNAITLCADAPVPQRVILFDDVCTTGATLYAAATTLRNSGAQQVFATTFCRVLD